MPVSGGDYKRDKKNSYLLNSRRQCTKNWELISVMITTQNNQSYSHHYSTEQPELQSWLQHRTTRVTVMITTQNNQSYSHDYNTEQLELLSSLQHRTIRVTVIITTQDN